MRYRHPVQMPRWPSNFVSGIKTKFKNFSGEICKKKFTGASHFSPTSLAKIIFKKCRDFIKCVVIQTKIQSAIEASPYLTLMSILFTFLFLFFKGHQSCCCSLIPKCKERVPSLIGPYARRKIFLSFMVLLVYRSTDYRLKV